jgi:hypothetical protein
MRKFYDEFTVVSLFLVDFYQTVDEQGILWKFRKSIGFRRVEF